MNNLDKLEKFILKIIGKDEAVAWENHQPKVLEHRIVRNRLKDEQRVKLKTEIEKWKTL